MRGSDGLEILKGRQVYEPRRLLSRDGGCVLRKEFQGLTPQGRGDHVLVAVTVIGRVMIVSGGVGVAVVVRVLMSMARL